MQKGLTILSENSKPNSKSELDQLPLKGFTIALKSDQPDWSKTLESKGDGRFTVKYRKIAQKRPF